MHKGNLHDAWLRQLFMKRKGYFGKELTYFYNLRHWIIPSSIQPSEKDDGQTFQNNQLHRINFPMKYHLVTHISNNPNRNEKKPTTKHVFIEGWYPNETNVQKAPQLLEDTWNWHPTTQQCVKEFFTMVTTLQANIVLIVNHVKTV